MITYSTHINNDNSVTFRLLEVTGEVEHYVDNFLRILPVGNGFSAYLGYGELMLAICEGSTGDVTSACYEVESDRLDILDKIDTSMGLING